MLKKANLQVSHFGLMLDCLLIEPCFNLKPKELNYASSSIYKMRCVKTVGKVAVWRGGDLSAITPKLLQLEAANGRGWEGRRARGGTTRRARGRQGGGQGVRSKKQGE